MRKVKLFEDDSNIGTASVLLHTCPRRGELEEGPSYTLILSVSQLEDGENLLKKQNNNEKHGGNYLHSLITMQTLCSPQHRFSKAFYLSKYREIFGGSNVLS